MNKASSSALAIAVLAGALVAVPAAAGAEQPPSFTPRTSPTVVGNQGAILAVQASIALGCSGSGSSDVASRKHSITNTAGHPIPKGTILAWTASNKGSGHVTLTSDLAPNGTVDVIEPGQTNGYTCTASFIPGPADFVLKSIHWTSNTNATVVIENASPWRDAGASTLRVWRKKCLTTVVSSVDLPVGAIGKGGTVTITVDAAKSGADYLEGLANATKSVQESNTANNDGKSPDFVQNKSCTPQ